MRTALPLLAATLLLSFCTAVRAAPSFGDDVSFLRRHCDPVILTGPQDRMRVAVAPAYQGRVMTSTANGPDGRSFGWVNRDFIRSGERGAHMSPFGGEDRFWLGPEGGQYSLYFPPGKPFELEHWQVPKPIDWGSWDVSSRGEQRVSFRKRMQLVNYSGAEFDIDVRRSIKLLGADRTRNVLGVKPGDAVRMVGFRSRNTIENAGERPWRKKSGLVSVWILGQFRASPRTTVVIPFDAPSGADPQDIVNDAYFGAISDDRLTVGEKAVFFKSDGKSRGKIGIGPAHAEPVLGSYNAADGVLTIVHYTRPEGVEDYVNSLWEMQEKPYGGDVVNSYNNGPTEPGGEAAAFFELESSSPAAALEPGEEMTHVHRTFHFTGPEEELDRISRAVLGVGLDRVTSALP